MSYYLLIALGPMFYGWLMRWIVVYAQRYVRGASISWRRSAILSDLVRRALLFTGFFV
jgi:hypothetical protein